MIKISEIKVPVGDEFDAAERAACVLGISKERIYKTKILRKSIDTRRRGNAHYVYTVAVLTDCETDILNNLPKNVSHYDEDKYVFAAENVHCNDDLYIIGSGPSGLFCALMLARAGARPTVIERGGSVDERSTAVEKFFCGGELDCNSNIQFGEGGAGTFSDGKLTCGVNDVRIRYVLEEFVKYGAPDDILINAKPHIGTDYLRHVVQNIRNEIIRLGGTFLFNTLMSDIHIKNGKVESIELTDLKNNTKKTVKCGRLVLAVGHSSRDTYELLNKRGFGMEKKPFSVGVRIEHRREYINMLQYKDKHLSETLPAADYKLSCHPGGRGVYTFCMCPGGEVVASTSERGGVVTNGMSMYARNAENSNSALLVSVRPEDIPGGVMDAVEFQRNIEHAAFKAGGGDYFAPCQRVDDFLNGSDTTKFGGVIPSYRPGVRFAKLSEYLPQFVCDSLKAALSEMNKKMRGFALGDALLTGAETRSSAPLRILRSESMQANILGVYPIGEGAGYAGGIMSSAVDGIKCAEHIAESME